MEHSCISYNEVTPMLYKTFSLLWLFCGMNMLTTWSTGCYLLHLFIIFLVESSEGQQD